MRGTSRMRKSLLLVVIALMSVFILAACSDDNDNATTENDEAEVTDETEEAENTDGESYVIGATQILEHPSLDEAYNGFQAAIEDAGLNVEYDYQNAQNDQNNVKTISDNFVADDVDLIFANSTPSALGALNARKDITILITSVTDAIDAGLVESMDESGGNITGVLDLHPDAIENTVQFIDEYFEGANVGLIYNAGEANSVAQIESVTEAGEGTSLTFSERDRKSTRLNSSHVAISYAVFCLKKKREQTDVAT